MTEIAGEDIATPKKRTQGRGRLRRAALIEACRALLKERELDEISLTEVAEAAGIPKSSAYHFFADIQEVYASTINDVLADINVAVEKAELTNPSDWSVIVHAFLGAGADYFNRNYDALQLVIGPKTPSAIKQQDRISDKALAIELRRQISMHFKLPMDIVDLDVFVHSIEIVDLFFSMSVMHHKKITAAYRLEAGRASCAYIGLYLPPILPRSSVVRTVGS